jgi:hypothetical protein
MAFNDPQHNNTQQNDNKLNDPQKNNSVCYVLIAIFRINHFQRHEIQHIDTGQYGT